MSRFLPDLNQPNFSKTTVTKQLDYLREIITPEPFILIGSSAGAYLSVLLEKEFSEHMKGMILFSPAIDLISHFESEMGEKLAEWKNQTFFEFEHYGLKTKEKLHYAFYEDLKRYQNSKIEIKTRSLCFHGFHDEIISYQSTEHFFSQQENVSTYFLNDDHSLIKTLPQIWAIVDEFLLSILNR